MKSDKSIHLLHAFNEYSHNINYYYNGTQKFLHSLNQLFLDFLSLK